jgi:hypothetical protein
MFLCSSRCPAQEHVGDPAAARVHDKSGDMPDIAVDGVDRVIAAHGHLSGRQDVIGEGLGPEAVDTGGSVPRYRPAGGVGTGAIP